MADDIASLLRATPTRDISEDMLRQLVAESISESQDLELKEQCSGDKWEVRKDAVAMTNGGGGTIIFGIQEDGEHRALKFKSIEDAVEVERQIHDWLINKIDPTLRFQLRTVSVDAHTLVVLRVEPPDNPPHCIEYSDMNRRFPVRQNRDTRPMTMDEIRNAMYGDQLRRDVSMIREVVEELATGRTAEVPLGGLSDQELVRNAKDSNQFAVEVLKRHL